jgi:hypothetical protein
VSTSDEPRSVARRSENVERVIRKDEREERSDDTRAGEEE